MCGARLEATLRLGVDAVALGLGHATERLVEHVRRVALAQHRVHRADLLQAAERVSGEGGLALGARQDVGRGRGQAEPRALPLHRLAEVGGAAARAVRGARRRAGHNAGRRHAGALYPRGMAQGSNQADILLTPRKAVTTRHPPHCLLDLPTTHPSIHPRASSRAISLLGERGLVPKERAPPAGP